MAIHDSDMSPSSISDVVSSNKHTKGNYFSIFNKEEVANETVAKRDIFVVKHNDLINMVYKYVAADQKVDYDTINNHSHKSYAFSKKVTYHNLSKNHILYVQDSSNVVIPVMPVSNLYEYSPTGSTPYEHVIISEEYTFGSDVAAEHGLDLIIKSLNDRPGFSTSPELLQMRDNLRAAIMAHRRDTSYNKTTQIKLYVTRRVTMNELRNSPRIYIPNLNVIVSLDENIYKIAHPTSVEGSRTKAKKGDIRDKSMPEFNETFELHMDLIDNDNKISSRYVNLFGKLVRIDPKRDPMRANGLYISQTLAGADLPETKKYYSFDELCELNIYNTEEDAVTYGSPDLIAEQLKRDKSYNEAYHAKVTSDVRIKTEAEKADVEIAKMKYETTANAIKTVAAVVSAAVVITTAIAKYKSK